MCIFMIFLQQSKILEFECEDSLMKLRVLSKKICKNVLLFFLNIYFMPVYLVGKKERILDFILTELLKVINHKSKKFLCQYKFNMKNPELYALTINKKFEKNVPLLFKDQYLMQMILPKER